MIPPPPHPLSSSLYLLFPHRRRRSSFPIARSSAVRLLPFLSSAPLARRRRKPRRGPCSLHRRAGHGSLHTRRQQWRARPPLSLPASFCSARSGDLERWWRPGAAAPVVGGRSEAGEAGSGVGGCGSGASGGGARREARCAGRGGGARHQRRPLPDPVFFCFLHTNFF